MPMLITKEQLQVAAFFASDARQRPQLSCVRFEPNRMVSTDGHRMAIVEAIGADTERDYPIHIDRAECDRFAKDLAKGAIVEVHAQRKGEDGPCFVSGHLTQTIGEAETKYPEYSQVLKEGPPHIVLVPMRF